MGSGCYSYSTAKLKADSIKASYDVYAATYGTTAARAQTFTQRSIDPEMDIKGKVRECRDTAEHPRTVPVIIALDVTGSMGHIPQYLVNEAFPEIMKKILDEGIRDVQVCFMGVGDHYYDEAPVQVGQFESSDDLMEKWLTKLYLEGGGGGNDGESYLLAWYAALKHTDCDALAKGRGGVLITIGDEPNLKSLSDTDIANMFGYGQGPVTVSDLYRDVTEAGWDVYHINVMDYMGSRARTIEGWRKLLGSKLVCTQDHEGKDIVDIIAGIVTSSDAVKGAKAAPLPDLPEEITVPSTVPGEELL